MVSSNVDVEFILRINDEDIERVISYRYLGTIIDSKRKNEEEINRRIKSAHRIHLLGVTKNVPEIQGNYRKDKNVGLYLKLFTYRNCYSKADLEGGGRDHRLYEVV